MARTIKPGLLFQAGVIPEPSRGGLEPTMSTYQYGDRLEGQPRPNTTYVVCKDWSVQDYHDPTRPIGWEILEDEKGWYYRVTQMNHKPKPVALYFRGVADPVPEGTGRIGSVVLTATQLGEITSQKDFEAEVTSRIREFTEAARNVKPETIAASPELTQIASMNPDMAACAAVLGDPEQTATMARFARGEMSYAEMRGLCG